MPSLGGESTLSEVGSVSGDNKPSGSLGRGDTVGRYLVLSILGSGGMGSVYAAHDPELDRKVALKIVRPTARVTGSVEDARQQLTREAQALARLSHPNVVAVHDVGNYEDGIFIAMEFVDGVTLRKWPRKANPSWRQVVEVFIAAGNGLAAAHDQDVVHRDFKPDNVMVDRSGRVCVLDFGLAQQEGEPLATVERRKGTPAYMAPERHAMRTSDARADQFSFCVALYELLYEQRPFSGANADEIAVQILRGRLRDPPSNSRVPSWVGRAVMRGLARDSDDRWPDMHALITELAGRPNRRGRAAAVVGGALVVGSVVAWNVFGGTTRDSCSQAREPVAKAWSDPQRSAIARALVSTDLPFAQDSATRVAAGLDMYADALGEALVDACAAPSDYDAAALELRRACLGQRVAALSATADLLSTGDAATAKGALDAVAALPPVAGCDDADEASYRAPVEPDLAAEVLAQLAEAQALRTAGKLKRAKALLEPLVTEVVRLEWPGMEARVRTLLGEILAIHGDPAEAAAMLSAAAEAAGRSGSGRLVAAALMRRLGFHVARGELPEVLALEPAVRAALIRGRGSRESAELDVALGNAFMRAGEYGNSQSAYQRAIDIAKRERNGGALATARFNLGSLQFLRGDYVGARETFRVQIEVSVGLYGAEHPRTMQQRTNLADALLMLGQAEAARAVYIEALELLGVVAGESAAERGRVERHLAEALGRLGRVGEGLKFAEAARDRLERTYGRGHVQVAASRATLADLKRWSGDDAGAEIDARAALEGLAAALGEDNPTVAFPRSQLAVLLVERGALDEAEVQLERAQAALEAVNPEHPSLVLVHMVWARLHAKRGAVALATLSAQRAEELAQGLSAAPSERAMAVHLLGLVSAFAGRDEAEVRKLASRAQALYEEIAPDPDADLEGAGVLLRDPAAAVEAAFGPRERG